MEKKTTEQIILMCNDVQIKDLLNKKEWEEWDYLFKTEWVRVEDVLEIIEQARKEVLIGDNYKERIESLTRYAHIINKMYDELSQSKPTGFEVQDNPEQSSEDKNSVTSFPNVSHRGAQHAKNKR